MGLPPPTHLPTCAGELPNIKDIRIGSRISGYQCSIKDIRRRLLSTCAGQLLCIKDVSSRNIDSRLLSSVGLPIPGELVYLKDVRISGYSIKNKDIRKHLPSRVGLLPSHLRW